VELEEKPEKQEGLLLFMYQLKSADNESVMLKNEELRKKAWKARGRDF
jgi:hypothetical protein